MRFLVVSDFHLRIPGNNELLEFSGIRKYCEEQYGYFDKYRFPDGFTVNDDKEYDEDAVKKYLHSERGKFVFHQKIV